MAPAPTILPPQLYRTHPLGHCNQIMMPARCKALDAERRAIENALNNRERGDMSTELSDGLILDDRFPNLLAFGDRLQHKRVSTDPRHLVLLSKQNMGTIITQRCSKVHRRHVSKMLGFANADVGSNKDDHRVNLLA